MRWLSTKLPGLVVASSLVVTAMQGPASAAAATGPDQSELREVPASFVIETGSDGKADPNLDLVEVETELSALFDAETSTSQDLAELSPYSAFAVASGFSVTYGDPRPPEDVRVAIASAIEEWDRRIRPTPGAPIVVEVLWKPLPAGVLGAAGPEVMYHSSQLPNPNVAYPAALVNVLLGMDANGPDKPEVTVLLNSDVHKQGRWYTGSGTPPTNLLDLRSVVAHEVAHGLGFLGSAGQYPKLGAPPYIYDAQISADQTPLTGLSNPSTALVSGKLLGSVSSSLKAKVYSPATWQQGSSLSHFDDSGTQSNVLMNPGIGATDVRRVPDSWTLGLMARLGWPITAPPLVPRVTEASVTRSTAFITWDYDLRSPNLPPDQLELRAVTAAGTKLPTVRVAASVRSYIFTGLKPATSYTLTVTPIASGRPGTPATRAIVTQNASGTGGSTGTMTGDPNQPSYIRNVPLDHQVSRVFQAFFLRYPDPSGFNYWVGQRSRRVPLISVYNQFVTSAEFLNRYGALSDGAFVELAYRNIFGRPPDPGGRAHWVGQLANGTPRAAVMMGLAESTEFAAKTHTIPAYSSSEGQIRRLYQAFFLRPPDSSGLSYWMSTLQARGDLASIADQFSSSAEFQQRYGSLSNAQFISLVYNNVLNRDPDSAGFNFWKFSLDAGMSRGQMMIGFSESPENIRASGTIP